MKNENSNLNKDNILAIIGIIFFIVLVIMVRTSPKQEQPKNEELKPTPTSNEKVEQEKPEEVSIFKSIDTQNYHYIYNIETTEQTEIIEGTRNDNKELFTITGLEKQQYAKVGSGYLIYQNGYYQPTTSEIRDYFTYITIDSIKEIMELSTYKKEENKIKFTIDTSDLLDEYTDIEYNGFEDFKDNTITLYCNDNNQVYKIELDYSDFFTHKQNQERKFKITMEFNKFGEIPEIQI